MKRKASLFSRFVNSRPVVLILGYLVRIVLTPYFWTLRITIENGELLTKNQSKPLIVALWHNRLFMLAPIIIKTMKPIHVAVLVSKSRDGNIPSAFGESYRGVTAIRVGHQSRHHALQEALEALATNHFLILTPDGPKGPIYKVKPGVIYAAQKSGAPVVVVDWHASKSFCLRSWDKFCIPYPFSRVVVRCTGPLIISPEESLEGAQARLEEIMR
jgi:lysophospholipid acyltransferase (LPLAT)-like uncharacterized protein